MFRTRLTNRSIRSLFLILSVFTSTILQAQTVIAFATPAPTNDTIRICNGSAITYNGVAFGYSSPNFIWSFNGGTPSNQFTSGPHNISYTTDGTFATSLVVTDGINFESDTVYVVVSSSVPNATFSPSVNSFCSSDAPITLSGGLPAGGTYFGPGVTNGIFDPTAAGAGIHNICYVYTENGGCSDTACQVFTVIQGPDATIIDQDLFTPFANCVAAGASSTYTLVIDNGSTTQATNTSYWIDWGDGSTPFSGATLPNGTSHTFNGLGNYTITVVVSAPNGCVDNTEYNFFNGKNPNVGIGIGASQGCVPFTLDVPILNTQNNPPGTTYEIEFGDGTVMTFQHPPPDTISYTYLTTSCGTTDILGNPNSYWVRLRATNPCGTTQAVASPIEVSQAPVMDLQANDSSICVGQSVTLTDLSDSAFYVSGGNCNFNYTRDWIVTPATGWTMTGSNSGSPVITFQDTGVYSVCIAATHPCGNDTACIQICVSDAPQLEVSSTANGSCAPVEVTFTNNTQFFTGCLPNRTGYVVNGTDSAWSTINGTSTSDDEADFIFTNPGTYTLTYYAVNDCDSVFYDTTIVVGGPPILTMPGDYFNCELETINYGSPGNSPTIDTNNATVLGYTWHVYPPTGWSYVDGTDSTDVGPHINFTDTGTYTVCLVVETTCGTDSACQTVVFKSGPSLQISPDTTVCYGSDITLGVGVTAGTPPFTYDWHTAPPSGFTASSDSISLTNLSSTTRYVVDVTDSNGCTSSAEVLVTVTPELIVDAGSNIQICAGDTFYLDGSISGGTPPYAIQWSPSSLLVDNTVEDPVGIGINNDTVFYLTVIDSLGCSSTDSVIVTVFQPILNVYAGPDTTYCNSNTVETLQNYTPLGGTWTGPGVVAPDGFNPSTAGSGVHSLIYTFTDANGCTDSDTVQITVIDPVPPIAGPDTVVCIDDSPVSLTGSPSGGTWTINGPSSLLSGSTFNPTIAGTFELYYTTGYGSCAFSDTITITVNPRPDLGGPYTREICSGDSILFTIPFDVPGSGAFWSILSQGSITGLTTSGTTSVVDTFYNAGSTPDTVIYHLWGIGPNPTDCAGDTATLTVIVNPLPDISNPVDSFEICSGDTFAFSPSSNIAGTQFIYDVISVSSGISGTNNGTGNIQQILLNSSASGYVHYQIYATGPSPTFCPGDTMDVYVLVHPLPQPDAGIDLAYCHNDSIQIISTIPIGSSWSWTPATGLSNPNDQNPWVIAGNTTGAPITNTYYLTVQDSATGCVNTDTVNVTINPLPPVDAGLNTSICIGDSAIIGTSNDPNFSYSWFVPGNPVFATTGIVSVSPDSTTTYRLVQVNNATGCVDSAEVTVTVIPSPEAGFVVLPDSGCAPLLINITDTSTVGVSHEWYINGVLSSNQQNPSFSLSNTSNSNDSTYTIQLIITAGTGCSDTASQTVTVHPMPVAGFFIPSAFCAPDSVTITQNSTYPAGSTFEWTVSSPSVTIYGSTDSIATFVFPDFQGNFDSTYTIWMFVESPFGCRDSISQSVTVYARPTAGFIMPANSCGPATISATATSSGTGLIYNYATIPSAGVTITNPSDANPTFNFPASTSDSVVYTIYQTATDSRGCADVDSAKFTVYPSPTADFIALPADSCGPLTLNLINTSSSNQSGMDTSTMSFSWDFGNGGVSNVGNPSVTYTNTGTSDTSYVITLYAQNAFGCMDTLVDTITIHPDPIAQLTLLNNTNCAPYTIDTASVSAITYPNANDVYTWEVLDMSGNILSTQAGLNNLTYTLVNDGDSVNIRLIVTSPFGCQNDTAESLFYTIENPVAGFSMSADSACSAVGLNITDTSTAGVSHEWYVDGVLFSTVQNPFITLSNSGTTGDSVYQITLIITAGSGCTDTTSQTVTVWPNPTVAYSATEVCLGTATQFTDLSTGDASITSWVWNFGDGTSDTTENPSHTYGAPGEYMIYHSVTDARGCFHAISDTITVRPLPVAEFGIVSSCGVDTICSNLPTTFFDLSSIVTGGGNITNLSWDVDGDGVTDYTGDSISHTFPTGGTATVQLIAETEYGCPDTIQHSFFIQSPPNADFALDTNYGCGPLLVNATNNSTGYITSYHWEVFADDGAGNRIVLYTANTATAGTFPTLQPSQLRDTTYYIELTVGNCCGFDTAMHTAVVRSNPGAGILPDNNLGCSPMAVEFQLDGQVTGNPTYLTIDYGDGTTDSISRQPLILPNGDTAFVWGAQNHNFVYSGPNLDTTFTVTLYAHNPCGVDTASVNITVRRATVNAFINAFPRSGCAPLTVTFANASYRGQNFSWCLDYDTITGNCNQPAVGDTLTYTYQTAGTYVVALFANDNCTYDTTFTTIEVFETPNVQFSANDVCVGDTTHFINQTTIGTGFINSYLWDFGDGTTSFLVNPDHIYGSAGMYNVQLIVGTSDGCPDTLTQTVTVHPGPVVQFDPVEICFNEQPFTFVNRSDTLQSIITNMTWNLGDGNTSSDYTPTQSYSRPGVYTVSLSMTTSNGCTDSTVQTVIIHGTPVAAFDTTKVAGGTCGAPMTYQFTDLSSSATAYHWDFDSSNPGVQTDTVQNPSHTYTSPGVYTVQLIVENNFGCPDTATNTIVVPPYPTASFSFDPAFGCIPLEVTFTNTSAYNFPEGQITQYHWIFGDGSSVSTSDSTVTHVYTTAGNFSVTLVVENSFGCTDTFTVNSAVQTFPRPEADFDVQVNSNGTVQFNNTSRLTDGNTTYHWDFGDGTTSSDENPLHDFDANRYGRDWEFDVCLVVNNPYGCPDSICQTVTLSAYILEVPNAFAPDLIGVGDGNVFLPKGNSIAEYHLEIFDAYGNIVFESTSLTSETGIPNEPWNGTYLNQGEEELPSGAYVWKVRAVFVDGYIWPGKEYDNGRVLKFGTVTLIR